MAERRPQVDPQGRPIKPQVAARQRSYGVREVSGDEQARSVMQGLAQLNPQLQSLADQMVQREAQAALEAGRAAGMNPGDPEGSNKAPDGGQVPFAFGENYEYGYRQSLAVKTALKAKQDYVDAASQEMYKPDFDPTTFANNWWGTQFAGLKDPMIMAEVGKARLEADDKIKTAHRSNVLKRAYENETEATNMLIRDTIRPDMQPDDVVAAWQNTVVPSLAANGFTRMTRAEQAELLYGRINEISNTGGGRPELFDVFNAKDPTTGLSVADMNPRIAASMSAAREQAENQRDRAIYKAGELDRAVLENTIRSDFAAGKIDAWDDDKIFSLARVNAITPQKAVELSQLRRSITVKEDTLAAARGFMRNREGWMVPEDDQKKIMEQELGPAMAMFLEASRAGDVTQAATIGGLILNAHTEFNSTVESPQFVRLFESIAKAKPSKDGKVPQNFQVAAELYKALPPNLQRLYAKGEAGQIFEQYVAQQNAGASDDAAYASAYTAADPEARARARKMVEDNTELRSSLQNLAQRSAVGSNRFWAKSDNWEAMSQQATKYLTDLALGNPNITPAQLEAAGTRFYEENYVFVRQGLTSGVAIQVPPRQANDGTRDALTAYMGQIAKDYRTADRNDGEWTAVLAPDNLQQGTYVVHMQKDGVFAKVAGRTSLGEIVSWYKGAKMPAADRAAMLAITAKVDAGTATREELEASRPLLARLRAMSYLPEKTAEKIEKTYSDFFETQVQGVPAMGQIKGTATRLADAPQGRAKVDPKMTAQVASSFLAQDPYGTDYRAQAKALITMGEAVVLQASDDPAQGAGRNIGMGYNLRANADNVQSDLRRAGVPPEDIQPVIDGKKALTPKYAMNLLNVAFERYEKLAIKAANGAAAGLWDRMSATQRAVLVDVAWQTGKPEQFTEALKALADGKADVGGLLKVSFTNRKGERVEDVRRNQLRTNMLVSPARFKAMVSQYGNLSPQLLASN